MLKSKIHFKKLSTFNSRLNPSERIVRADDLVGQVRLSTCARVARERGFGIIEIIVAVAVISVALFTIQQVSFLYLKQNIENKKNLKASYYAEEALEAVRSIRDQGWTANIASLTMGANYYPIISSNKWTLTATNPGVIENIYTGQVVIDNVSRDSNDNIVSSGGTDDPNTKKATVTILWEGKSTILTTYLTNLYNN